MTDANAALGLADGVHSLGDQKMEVKNGKATVLGTDTLCGSIANLDKCLRIFKDLVGKNIFVIIFYTEISILFATIFLFFYLSHLSLILLSPFPFFYIVI